MINKRIIYIIMIIIMNISVHSQIQVDLKDNTSFIGIVLKNTNDSLVIKSFKNEVFTFRKDNIKEIIPYITKIKLITGREYIGYIVRMDSNIISIYPNNLDIDQEVNISKIDILDFIYMNPEDDKNILLGIGIFHPSGINLISGYRFKNFGLKTSLGFDPWNSGYGGNASIYFDLIKIKEDCISLSLSFGYKNDKFINDYYLSPNFTVNIKGIFIEGGIGLLFNESGKSKYFISSGYIYRF